MSVRRLVDAFVKILGLYYAVSAVQQLAYLIALVRARPPREFNISITVIAEVPVILSKTIVAVVLLYAGAAMVNWLVGKEELRERDEGTASSRADLLYVGTCLVGLVFVLGAVPEIGRYAVLGVWYAGAERQPQASALWTRASVELLLRSAVGALCGLALLLRAGPVAAWLDRRAGGDENDGEAGS
jgi:hypothetical protein